DRPRPAPGRRPRDRVERPGREPAQPAAVRLPRLPGRTAARAVDARRHAAVARADRDRAVGGAAGGRGATRSRARPRRSARQRTVSELDREPRRRRSCAGPGAAGRAAARARVCGAESRERAVGGPVVGHPMRHEVKLSSADRVLFPDDGITKGDLFDYYDRVADVLIPHLKDRPFTMKRWREGLPGGSFFQKQAPKGMPDWIETRQFRTWPRGGKGESRLVDFPLVESREALLWMVQMHCIDMNAWYSRVDKPDRPDWVLFDLDPPEEPDAFVLCIRVAHLVHEALDALGLSSYVKTSGADGIHVLVPIARRSTYADTYEFAELL